MPRPEKVQAVQEIKERITGAEAVFLTEFRGLTVKQLQSLRRSLRQAGAEYRVMKMTLARRAAEELGLEGLVEHLSGPTALAFTSGDPVPVAKAIRDFTRETDRLVVKAGIYSGDLLLPEEISRLADIESREVLLAKVAGAAKAPLYQAAGLFGAFTRNAASLFFQLLTKKESEAPPSGEAAPAAETAPDEITETKTADEAEEE